MRSVLFVLLATLAITSGCGVDDPPVTDDVPMDEVEPLQVRTTSFPADFLVARIAGDRVDRINLLPTGEDAPFWQPSAEVVASLPSRAKGRVGRAVSSTGEPGPAPYGTEKESEPCQDVTARGPGAKAR